MIFRQLSTIKLTTFILFLICLKLNNTAFASTIYNKITQPLFGEVSSNIAEAIGVTREIYQDKDGLLWLLDDNYLFKYDGYKYERINFIPDDKTFQLSDFAFDKNDNIWITSSDAGVFKYNIHTKEKQHLFVNTDSKNSLVIHAAFNLLLDEDSLYISTADGIYKVNVNDHNYKHYTFQEEAIASSVIYKDNQNTVWVGTNHGLYFLSKGSLQKFITKNELFNKAKVVDIHQSKNNKVWLTTTFSGAWTLDKTTHQLTELPKQVKSNTLHSIIELPQQIWLQTGDNGIEVRDLETGHFIRRIEHDPSVNNGLSTNKVTELYKDNAGIIWVGISGPKLHYYNNHNQAFSYARPSPSKENAISYSRVRGIGQLSDDTLLLSSHAGGKIDVITPTAGKVDEIEFIATHRGEQRHLIANQFYQDSQETMWIITFPAFLVHYNFTTQKTEYFPAPLLKQRNGAILNIIKDPKAAKLWLPMSEGLLSFDLITKTFSRPDFNFNGPLYTIAADSKGNIWTGNKNGLYWLEFSTNKWHHLDSGENTGFTLNNNQVGGVLVDSNDQLWVGSQFQLFKKQKVLNHQVIFDEILLPNLTEQIRTTNLLEDNQGNIWISRHAFLNPKTFKTFEISTLSPFDRNSFTSVFLKTKQGELLFGGDEGLNFITPNAISAIQKKPNLLINAIAIDDEPIQSSREVLVIPANTKNTSIHFTGIDLTHAQQLTYKYRIIGYNDNWRNTEDNSRFISFTSLPPGGYIIEIEVSNHLGNSTTKSLSIQVLPTIYQTLWFKLLSLFLITMTMWLIIRWRVIKQAKIERKHNEMKLAAEQAENIAKLASERATMMDEVLVKKNQLLADVSHELRTPLTVLQIEIETLQHDFSDDVQASYSALRKKVADMDSLIDDISQLAKSDIGALQFDFSPEKIKPLTLKIEAELKRFVVSKGFNWHSDIELNDDLTMNIDKVKTKQLLINLISNSIKYTDAGGDIELTLTQNEEHLIIKINDSAPTVATKHLENIFERLYRVESSRSRATGGSGLGLSICKSIVNAHQGDIFATQSPLGGLSIVIKLPMA